MVKAGMILSVQLVPYLSTDEVHTMVLQQVASSLTEDWRPAYLLSFRFATICIMNTPGGRTLCSFISSLW